MIRGGALVIWAVLLLLAGLCGCASRVATAPSDAGLDAHEASDELEDVGSPTDDVVTAPLDTSIDAPKAFDDSGGVDSPADDIATDAGGPEPAPPRPPRLLAAGARHTCAIRAGGQVWCWGVNFDGQLGSVPQVADAGLLPVVVPGLNDAFELSAGTGFTCALRRSGRVLCWGNNDYGQRGLRFVGPGTSSGPDAEVSGLNDAVAIESGAEFSCARRVGGAVVCWGRNQSRQCGRSGPDVLTAPAEVSLVGVVEVAAGFAHACVRVRTGNVLCWGSNSSGQLGVNPAVTGPSRSTPGVLDGLSGVVAVRGAGEYSCARMTGGSIRCWGRNNFGQLGDGTVSDRWMPSLVTNSSRIIEVVPGESHACGRVDDGGALCWGRSEYGATGSAPRNVLIPTRVDGLSDVTAIALGVSHSCASLGDGRIVCWGLREQGVLGDGWYFPPEVQLRPISVQLP